MHSVSADLCSVCAPFATSASHPVFFREMDVAGLFVEIE